MQAGKEQAGGPGLMEGKAKEMGLFTKDWAEKYDAGIAAATPGRDGIFTLSEAHFAGLPEDARILCIGVGTGTEIVSLATKHPGEPSLTGLKPRIVMACLTFHCLAIQDAPNSNFAPCMCASLASCWTYSCCTNKLTRIATLLHRY